MYICIYHSYLRVKHPLANVDDIRPQFQVDNDLVTDETGVFNSTTVRDIAVPVNATIEALDQIPLSEVQGFKALALPWYTDQVLPFDVTIACANEYGAAASSKIFGIEILNEGFGTSIDDSVIEQQATLLAGRRRLFTRSGGNNYQGIDVGRNRNFPRAPAPSPGCQRPDPALHEPRTPLADPNDRNRRGSLRLSARSCQISGKWGDWGSNLDLRNAGG